MLSQLKGSYQRLEQSLQRLTDSIAAYKPSTNAADELVAADEAVAQDLERLQRHQANHARLQSLRQTSAALDQQLRDNVRLLADIRRDIKAIPAHVEQSDVQPIPVDDLLSYAKFISKTSVPPTLRQPLPEITLADVKATSTERETSRPPNGTAAAAGAESGDGEDAGYAKTDNVGLRAVDEQTKRNLNPLEDLPFEPWPAYSIIQQGSLAEIQRMVDAGKDPAKILSAEDQAEADRLKQEEEERERAEHERREMRRMSTFSNAASRTAAQSDVFDPDEA